jgi:hypothetical protein
MRYSCARVLRILFLTKLLWKGIMMQSQTLIETGQASKYLQQLCKHFAHKTEVTFSETEAHCVFGTATADMRAKEQGLEVIITAEDPEGIDRGQMVIWKHLERFAFREDLSEPVWQTA